MSTDTTTGTARADYIAGLHALADLLEAHPELRLPLTGTSGFPMRIYASTARAQQARAQIAAWARALPGVKSKTVDDCYLMLDGNLGGLHVQVKAYREDVCERVVVGTEKITEKVPDPAVVRRVPLVKRTRTVEIVDWVCPSLLADGSAELAVAGVR